MRTFRKIIFSIALLFILAGTVKMDCRAAQFNLPEGPVIDSVTHLGNGIVKIEVHGVSSPISSIACTPASYETPFGISLTPIPFEDGVAITKLENKMAHKIWVRDENNNVSFREYYSDYVYEPGHYKWTFFGTDTLYAKANKGDTVGYHVGYSNDGNVTKTFSTELISSDKSIAKISGKKIVIMGKAGTCYITFRITPKNPSYAEAVEKELDIAEVSDFKMRLIVKKNGKTSQSTVGKVSIKSTSTKGKKVTVKWKKAKNAKKYVMRWADNPKMKNAKTKTIKKSSLSAAFSKKKKGKKYWVQIEAVNGDVRSVSAKKKV